MAGRSSLKSRLGVAGSWHNPAGSTHGCASGFHSAFQAFGEKANTGKPGILPVGFSLE